MEKTAVWLSTTALALSCASLLVVVVFVSAVVVFLRYMLMVEDDKVCMEVVAVDPQAATAMDARDAARDAQLLPLAEQLRVDVGVLRGLTCHESRLLTCLVPRGRLGITWEDVGGCDDALDQIWQQLVLPLVYARYIDNDPGIMPAKGILLHGHPGCGKTLIAKAITAEVDSNFLSIDLSKVRDKWLGESEKMADAIFTLAYKIQPCIIFIDEVDALLGRRAETDCNTDLIIKSVFLSRWDGLETDEHAMVFILAATNRRHALDPAVLRRFPLQFNIPKPNEAGRREILEILLRGRRVDADVDVAELARVTNGFTGSDLKEVVRCASVSGLQELLQVRNLREPRRYSQIQRQYWNTEPRPITMADLLGAIAVTSKEKKTDLPFYF